MDILECIKKRRSVRRFTDQPISEEVLQELLEAIQWAPSWANTQCWEVVIIKEQENKEKLAAFLSPNNPSTKGIVEAPVVAVFCARKGKAGFKGGAPQSVYGDWCMFDTGIASQNFCLAACELGLGTVHVGSIDHQAIDDFLGLPEDVITFEVIPVGYPAQESRSPARKPVKDFVYAERFGNPL